MAIVIAPLLRGCLGVLAASLTEVVAELLHAEVDVVFFEKLSKTSLRLLFLRNVLWVLKLIKFDCGFLLCVAAQSLLLLRVEVDQVGLFQGLVKLISEVPSTAFDLGFLDAEAHDLRSAFLLLASVELFILSRDQGI